MPRLTARMASVRHRQGQRENCIYAQCIMGTDARWLAAVAHDDRSQRMGRGDERRRETVSEATGMIRNTRQRADVLALLREVDGFHSAQQLHQMLLDRQARVGLTTVYRTLQMLVDTGELDSTKLPGESSCTDGAARAATTITWSAASAAARSRSPGRPWSGGPTRSPASTASPTSATPWRSSAPAAPAPPERHRQRQPRRTSRLSRAMVRRVVARSPVTSTRNSRWRTPGSAAAAATAARHLRGEPTGCSAISFRT